MALKFQTSDSRTFALFAPLALSVLVLVPTVYFSTHQTPGGPGGERQQAFANPRQSPAEQARAGVTASASAAPRAPDTDFARHVGQLKKRLPAGEFTIVIQSPFVVIGDGTPAAVRAQAETVRWAVEKLKQEYFEKDPAEILDVWLFRNEASYRKHALEFFNDRPDTPYGYYSSAHRALIMNIETGGGTLVHEIVHPFVEANFPSCPPWLNEGLGSLYEQSGEQDGHIHGYTNWRLPGLQQAIKAGSVPSFKALTMMDANAFYNEDRGTNYGQARYLCYYLQEKGLLAKFYKEFYTHRMDDPTGYKTLQTVLGEGDMDAFKERWEKFVLGLSEAYRLLAPAE
ncbi:MAG TPA: hypothetical protein VEV81_00995 [Pyrinomonadaceae bacterium]|nr:hypothetical protein [Pyrinomonadaceae bacterium]